MDSSIIVNNIKLLCREYGISIASLEKKTNLSPGLISRWTKVMPSLDRLIDVAHFFDVSIDSIVGNQPGLSLISKEQQLIDLLLNQTLSNKTVWNFLIPDPDIISNNLGEYVISLLSAECEFDCFFTTFENGFFLLQASYPVGSGKLDSLTLYAFPDKHTMPMIQSKDNSALDILYQTVKEKLDSEVSTYKANIFTSKYIKSISDNHVESYDKEITTEISSSKITKIS